ncbi:hypothetical protein BDP55DRAFT_710168 [Colletotrichum godetiae]|uniref:Uncharacterized protein n=1 Tax=Colletotrichum godetiae TaxID=1209918 RepID=A0AAJ0EZW9_9PEZI|nr:uncharacterized protein BDP55DRAFT_710168 [Colletotrichum godetiae]KAK1700558.1 hypothetical protein BDP55DRAFT_710168 [Colletotrichum godetiae]
MRHEQESGNRNMRNFWTGVVAVPASTRMSRSVHGFLALALESKPPPVPRRSCAAPSPFNTQAQARQVPTPILVSSVEKVPHHHLHNLFLLVSLEIFIPPSPQTFHPSLNQSTGSLQPLLLFGAGQFLGVLGETQSNYLTNALSLTIIEDRLRRISQLFARDHHDPHDPHDTHVVLAEAQGTTNASTNTPYISSTSQRPQPKLSSSAPYTTHPAGLDVLSKKTSVMVRRTPFPMLNAGLECPRNAGCELQTATPHDFMHKERSQRSSKQAESQ